MKITVSIIVYGNVCTCAKIISIQSLMKLHYAQKLIDRRKFVSNDLIADLQIDIKKNVERNFWIHLLSHESLPVLADEVPRESTPDLILRDVDYDVSGILFSDFSWIY